MVASRPVIWSTEAQADLSDIWNYYAHAASPRTADNIVRRIAAATEQLVQSPYAGRARGEIRAGLRSVVASPHVVFYRVAADLTAEIVRVLDGRRDIDAVFDEG
jgi:toxin ParE1/3/4